MSTILSRVAGASEFKKALEEWAEQLDVGFVVPTEITKQFFINAKRPEYTAVLTPYLSGPPNNIGILAAYLLLRLDVLEATREEAINYLLKSIEVGGHTELTTFCVMESLDKIPSCFEPAVAKAIASSDTIRGIAAASLVEKLEKRNLDLVLQGLAVLRKEIVNRDSTLRFGAALGLASYGVHLNELTPAFIECLELGEAQQVAQLATRLTTVFGENQTIVDYLCSKAGDETIVPEVRGYLYLHLGRICPSSLQVQTWLANELSKVKDCFNYDMLFGIGFGLCKQELPIPDSTKAQLIDLLNCEDSDIQILVAIILSHTAEVLTETDFEKLAIYIRNATNDEMRGKLIRCFFEGGPQAIPVAMRHSSTASIVIKPLWIGALAQQLERHGFQFLEVYRLEQNEELDQIMIYVMGQASLHGQEIIDIVKASLRSDSELERFNALSALRSSGSGAAAATPELVTLYLYGNSDEQVAAERIMVNIGEAAAPFLNDFSKIQGKDCLKKFQRLQRMIGVDESSIKHVELVRLGKPNIIRSFVIVGTIFEELGTISQRRLQVVLDEQLSKNPAYGINELPSRSWQRHIEKLEQFLSSMDVDSETVKLLKRDGKKPQFLTHTGKRWLKRCREFLVTIG